MDQLLEFGQKWRVQHGDCISHMSDEMPAESVDFSIFSPPFPSLYAYTDSEADIGNVDAMGDEAKLHLGFFYKALARVIKPGRAVVVHVMQIPKMKRSGEEGLYDFRGANLRIAERAGLIFEYDWLVRKNPQSQALRTRSRELQFAGLESDRAKSRGALCDYLLKFRKPGDNALAINSESQVTRNDWIKWAEGCWDDIHETDTLNVSEGRAESDTKHICLARGSLVLTKDGYKPIQDVEIGDMVLTHMGRWRPVLAKEMTGVNPVVAVRAQGVHDLTLTPTHKVWARSSRGKKHPKAVAGKATPEWIESKNLKGEYVNFKLPRTESPSEESLLHWWIVGRWLADGHIDKRNVAHISCGEAKLTHLLAKIGDIAGKPQQRTAFQVPLKDKDFRIRTILDKCGKLAHGKHLPSEAFTLPEDYASQLLEGYLSGDGHYNEERQRWYVTSVSKELLLGIAFLVQRARGQIASLSTGRGPGTTIIEGRTVNTRQEWTLSWGGVRHSFSFMATDGAWKKVKSVVPVGETETWNLRVAEDESYTAEGCIVKNCPLQLEVIRRCILLFSNPGEIVFSPFTGIGSEGFVALGGKSPKTRRSIGHPRRFYGCELKREYFDAATRNLRRAEEMFRQDREMSLPFPDDDPLSQPARTVHPTPLHPSGVMAEALDFSDL